MVHSNTKSNVLIQSCLIHHFRFMQVMLPCDDMYLRSAATQRPNYKIGRYDRLPLTVERELTNLLERYFIHPFITYNEIIEKLPITLKLNV